METLPRKRETNLQDYLFKLIKYIRRMEEQTNNKSPPGLYGDCWMFESCVHAVQNEYVLFIRR